MVRCSAINFYVVPGLDPDNSRRFSADGHGSRSSRSDVRRRMADESDVLLGLVRSALSLLQLLLALAVLVHRYAQHILLQCQDEVRSCEVRWGRVIWGKGCVREDDATEDKMTGRERWVGWQFGQILRSQSNLHHNKLNCIKRQLLYNVAETGPWEHRNNQGKSGKYLAWQQYYA